MPLNKHMVYLLILLDVGKKTDDDSILSQLNNAYESAIDSFGRTGSTDQSFAGSPNLSGTVRLLSYESMSIPQQMCLNLYIKLWISETFIYTPLLIYHLHLFSG